MQVKTWAIIMEGRFDDRITCRRLMFSRRWCLLARLFRARDEGLVFLPWSVFSLLFSVVLLVLDSVDVD